MVGIGDERAVLSELLCALWVYTQGRQLLEKASLGRSRCPAPPGVLGWPAPTHDPENRGNSVSAAPLGPLAIPSYVGFVSSSVFAFLTEVEAKAGGFKTPQRPSKLQ